MKWYCIVCPDKVAGGFKHDILYLYRSNHGGETRAFNGKNWEVIDTDLFLFLHTLPNT